MPRQPVRRKTAPKAASAPTLPEIAATIRARLAVLDAERDPLQAALDAFDAFDTTAPAVEPVTPVAVATSRRRKPGKQPGEPTVKQQIMAIAGAEGSVSIERVCNHFSKGGKKMYPSWAREHLDKLVEQGRLEPVGDPHAGRYAHANAPIPLHGAKAA